MKSTKKDIDELCKAAFSQKADINIEISQLGQGRVSATVAGQCKELWLSAEEATDLEHSLRGRFDSKSDMRMDYAEPAQRFTTIYTARALTV